MLEKNLKYKYLPKQDKTVFIHYFPHKNYRHFLVSYTYGKLPPDTSWWDYGGICYSVEKWQDAINEFNNIINS